MKNFRTGVILVAAALVGFVTTTATAQHAAHYVLDGYGGVHAGGGAPAISPAPFYFGWDVAVDVEVFPHDGTPSAGDGILVLDKFGGVHRGGVLAADPPVGVTPYFGFDVARAIVRRDASVVYSASVYSSGALEPQRNRGVTSATRLSTGKYRLTFARNIAYCNKVATLGDAHLSKPLAENGAAGMIWTFQESELAFHNKLIVITRNASGNPASLPFHVMLHC